MFEAWLPSVLAFGVPLYDLFRGSCLSGGFIEVSEGKKGLRLKLSKSTIKKITSDFLRLFTQLLETSGR